MYVDLVECQLKNNFIFSQTVLDFDSIVDAVYLLRISIISRYKI